MNPILIIPARMGATRLPNKPLFPIGDKTLLGHVLTQAHQTFKGPIIVACCEEEVKTEAQKYHTPAFMTDPSLESGTDRVYAAYKAYGKEHDIIINIQGDMAIFPDTLIQKTLEVFKVFNNCKMQIDVATAVSLLDEKDKLNPACVKAAFEPLNTNNNIGQALYFSRSPIPYYATQFYKHLGIYAYTENALEQFVKTPLSLLESQEKLEQIRGLSLGHRYGAALVEGECYSVDTLEDAQFVEMNIKNI